VEIHERPAADDAEGLAWGGIGEGTSRWRYRPATNKKRRKGRGPGDPGDDDAGVLERLAGCLQHAVTGEADLAGMRDTASAEETDLGDALDRELQTRVADGRAHSIPTLTHRRVREADRTHGRGSTTALATCLKYRE